MNGLTAWQQASGTRQESGNSNNDSTTRSSGGRLIVLPLRSGDESEERVSEWLHADWCDCWGRVELKSSPLHFRVMRALRYDSCVGVQQLEVR